MLAAIVEHARECEALKRQSYWAISRGPLASLVFVTPLLALYEWGVVQLGPRAIRNGADLWLRGLLDLLGFGQYFLLPAVTVALLLAWHHLSRGPWKLPLRVVPGMALESLALAVSLVLLAQLQGAVCQAIGLPAVQEGEKTKSSKSPASHLFGATEVLAREAHDSRAVLLSAATASPRPSAGSRLVAFLGAGIYEEVLFRLLLLPACAMALAHLGVPRAQSILWAAIATSLLFALAHYVGPHGDRWQAFSFVFRALAGSFFAALFVYRGFGVAAGAHAGYDILVGLS